ncbi:MAG: DUF1028 domain-containing protein [Cytophagia bacterium]|nr:DUF1028 domain-containing protein [Cytophagia bacterium]
MTKYVTTLAFVLFAYNYSLATWSIIIIDPETKEIGIAGASCTYSCYGIGKIIPNVGAIIVQAMSNSQAREKGIHMILAGAPPEQIIEAMRDSIFDPERQQYAVITIKYIQEPRIYTGQLTHSINGGLTDYGVSVQGNTLASDQELEAIMIAVRAGKENLLHIAELLMTALEAGSVAGGDKRCGEQKATSAFLIVAKPTDKKPYLDLLIFGQGKGKQNAVDLLRIKYNKWKSKHGDQLTTPQLNKSESNKS